MADRQVTQSRKDADGDITHLCNPGQVWSPVSKADVIMHIENKLHTYYVKQKNHRSEVYVYESGGKKHLKTTPDGYTENNLDNLPDC